MNNKKNYNQLQDELSNKIFNSKYREDFLYFLSCSQNKSGSVQLLEGTKSLPCTIEAYEPSLRYLAVSNLQTPIGTQKQAVLRSNDIVQITFQNQSNL